jgi:hypothetical protein
MCYAEEYDCQLNNKRTKRVFAEKGCRSTFCRIRANYHCTAKRLPSKNCRQWRGVYSLFLLITSASTWMYVMPSA